MVNWKDHGEIFKLEPSALGTSRRRFYVGSPTVRIKTVRIFYFPIRAVLTYIVHGKSESQQANIRQKILKYKGYIKGIDDACGMIDPCVFIDDDGQAYLYHGGCGRIIGAKMKDNMMELAEKPRSMEGLKDFHEGAWVHKRNGIYYLMYSDNVPIPKATDWFMQPAHNL